MPIIIKLKSGQIVLGKHDQDVKRTEVDRNSDTLHIFDKLDQNGDQTLSVEEMQVASENLKFSSELERTLENSILGRVLPKKNEEIEAKIDKINSKNIHAVLAGFQIVTDHANTTLNEWHSRNYVRDSGYSPLTLTQAIVNYKRIDNECKKRCLNKLVDIAAESAKDNSKLDENTKQKYVRDLKGYIASMKFKGSSNADLINALMYELMPNNGCTQGHESILRKYGYTPKPL